MDIATPEGIQSSRSLPDQYTSIRISRLQSGFNLETDATLQGLGVVLSQREEHD